MPDAGGRRDGALLEVRDVTRAFGGLVAVRNLSFEVREGEFLSIIGPNGAGKTTVFNLITGLYRPNAGDIRLDGRTIVGLRPHRVAALGIGRTFQIPQPFSDLSVRENVLVAAFVRGTVSAARRRADRAMSLTGLAGRADALPRTLTVAGRKRLEVARALATAPRLLLLDEVIAGLNHTEMAEMVEVIRRLRGEGIAAVAGVEHVMAAVVRLSDRILVLDQGRRIAEGTPDEVMRAERVIDVYLGREEG